MHTLNNIYDYDLPECLACPPPTELRGMRRDEVRLLVTACMGEKVEHSVFHQLPNFLRRGDVLVVNTSATVPAAIPLQFNDGGNGRLHFSTKLSTSEWLVEIRRIRGNTTTRWTRGVPGMELSLADGSILRLKELFQGKSRRLNLWKVDFDEHRFHDLITNFGKPIQYDGLERSYPMDYYQSFFSFRPGSSEMPSAGRGFTKRLIENLMLKGVAFAPILLHTGVSSLEAGEKPYPEYVEVDPISASIINAARVKGGRVIAVGTTVLRALESAANGDGTIKPYAGFTDLYIQKDYAMKVTDGLLTGFHEPKASHLHMLHALAGIEHLETAYSVALDNEYYWHVFGDNHLILP